MNYTLPIELQQLINAEQAYHYRIIPTEKEGNKIVFKTDNGNIATLQSELFILLGLDVDLKEENSENINTYLSTNYRKSKTSRTTEIHYSNDFLEKGG